MQINRIDVYNLKFQRKCLKIHKLHDIIFLGYLSVNSDCLQASVIDYFNHFAQLFVDLLPDDPNVFNRPNISLQTNFFRYQNKNIDFYGGQL